MENPLSNMVQEIEYRFPEVQEGVLSASSITLGYMSI